MDVEKLHNEGVKITFYPYKFYYCETPAEKETALVISVPKKLFKRAVKRNLIRRRIKEAFRHISGNYPLLRHKDCLIVYISNEVFDYGRIKEGLETILAKIS